MTPYCEKFKNIFLEHADDLALIYKDRKWSYNQLLVEGRRRAKYLKIKGLQPGSKLLIHFPDDRVEFLFSILAGIIGGYDLIPVSQKAKDNELEYIRNIVQPDFIWTESFHEVSNDLDINDTDFQNIRIIFFTSGTTSSPKGVCHEFENLLSNANAFNHRSGLKRNVCMLNVMPTGYMAGLLNTFFSPLMARGTIVLADSFDVRMALDFWKYPMENGVNTIWFTPSMIATLTPLCRDEIIPNWARTNLRHVFVGTAPLHSWIREDFRKRFGVNCLDSYGTTECLFISVNPVDVINPDDATVGLLLPEVKIEVRNARGAIQLGNQEGDIWLNSPYTMTGYLDGLDSNLEVKSENSNWLDTGDIGCIDNAGRLSITGRRKDLIIHGGINVSPKHVEDILLRYSGVQDAAVVGSPHPFWGEEVLAYVIPEGGGNLDADSLNIYCDEHLSTDARPSQIIFVNEFPRTSNGKIQKHLL